MATEATVPVIDMQDLSGLTENVLKACEEWGCFRIINHGVPLELMSEIKVVGRTLLDLPMEIKLRNCHPISNQGYTKPTTNPLFEGLSIFDISRPGSIDRFINQLDASNYKEVISKYYVAVLELANDLLCKLSEGLGVATGDGFKDWICQMKLDRYNYSLETVGLDGAVMHTDPGMLTLLCDNEVIGGLEVERKHTGEWVSVHPIPGTFVVIVGDACRVWSNGKFHNANHRVHCYEPRVRLSVPFFVLCPRDRKIETAKELVDSQHPPLYIAFDFEDYRKIKAQISNREPTGTALELFRAPKRATSETLTQ